MHAQVAGRRGDRAHAGLVEAATAKSAAPAAVESQVVGRLVAQRALGLHRAEGLLAHLAGVSRAECRRRQERGGRVGGVLPLILVVADRRVELPLLGELVGRVGEHRPGVVVLRVRQEREVGIGRVRIGRIDNRRLIDPRDAQSPVDDVVGGDEALRVDEVRARDPREVVDLVGREAQLLAVGLHVDELALAQIERPALGRRRCRPEAERTVIGDGRDDRAGSRRHRRCRSPWCGCSPRSP